MGIRKYSVINQETDMLALLASIYLFFLPFSQALTINLGFPLKISEISVILFFSVYCLFPKFILLKRSPFFYAILFLILFILISVIVNIFKAYPYPLDYNYARISPGLDSFLKFSYVLLAVGAMGIASSRLLSHRKIIQYLFKGAVVSACYSWYLFLSGLTNLPPLLLPGMDEVPQTIKTPVGEFIRCGTFKEGNYLGLYLVLVGVLAFYFNRTRIGIFLFSTVITTFSTASFVAIFLFILTWIITKYKKYRLKMSLVLILYLSILSSVLMSSESFRIIIYNKLFASEDEVENTNDVYSRLDRINTMNTAFEIFRDNPVWGVGLSNFGLHFNHYDLLPSLTAEDAGKRIPNNVYAEILCEAGLLSFIMFIYILFHIYRVSKRKSITLQAGLVACYIYLFAFPTFTMLFVWSFWGICINSTIKSRKESREISK